MPATETQITLDQFIKEQNEYVVALSKPIEPVLNLDSLLGPPVEGYEGTYWHSLPNDLTETGILVSGNGVRIPCTTHIPTGSKTSYRKIFKVINGVKTSVWEIHQKDLNSSHHEPYDLS